MKSVENTNIPDKEEEIQRLLGNIKILRPAALGAVGGATVGRPVEILLYNERIGILLHHLYMYNKPFEMDLSQEYFWIDDFNTIAQS